MRIIIFGPQGAGKGTQAAKLVEKLDAEHIATGDLVRAEIKQGTELGQKIQEYNDKGELVPDEIIIEMTKPYLSENDSWILDGFPRNQAQAKALDEALEEINEKVDRVIALEASDEDLVKRLSGRRQSDATGKTYHIEHDPPPKEGSEEDAGPFVQREDDTEEAIRTRLDTYHEQTEPLKDYYGEQGILVTVDASKSIDEVTEEVMKAVGENK
ncbi:MAG TPA: adenylate kinase [Rubrobacteraceae bacterium]|jgi:adenylate kinase|nr:adenylate kinase [Rubrobacteraceae bacterium]HZG64352.1 adenylate kinase [Rubrobacteraceae bacterium]